MSRQEEDIMVEKPRDVVPMFASELFREVNNKIMIVKMVANIPDRLEP